MTANASIPVLRIPEIFVGPGGSVWNSVKPYQIWYGGRGSSKSWSKAIQYMLKAQTQPYFRGIFARDTQKNVRNSQFQLFKDLAKKFDCFRGQFDFQESGMKIECKATGNLMMGGSFEQPDTLRSVADPTDFWAEEPITRASQINRQDFFDITGSLRNSEGVPTIFHFTFNPISKQTWIYEDFFQKGLYDAEIVFANYWNNPFCPQSTLNFLESLRQLDLKRYKVDGLGHWGVAYEGLVYPNYTPVDSFPKDTEGNEMPAQFYGLDFGWTDPTCLVEMAVEDTPDQPKKSLFVNELIYETHLNSNDLIAKFKNLGVKKHIRMICDSARPEMINDLMLAGYNAEACTKYAGSVRDGIASVQKYAIKVVRGAPNASKNLFDEIATYCFEMKKDRLTEDPEDKTNHAMDAIRYGVESLNHSPSGSREIEDF